MNITIRPGSYLDPFSDDRSRARLWRVFGVVLMTVETFCIAR